MRSFLKLLVVLAGSLFALLSCNLDIGGITSSDSGSSGGTGTLSVYYDGYVLAKDDQVNLGFYTADASTHRWTFSFTLRNSGSGQLVLNGTPAIYVTGPNVANFTVLPPANFALSPGSSTTMTLAFLHPRNASNGNKSATISIPNSGGTTFTFLVNVNSTAAPALKVQYYASYKDPAVPTYGVITSGSTANLRYYDTYPAHFKISNTGWGPLALSSATLTSASGNPEYWSLTLPSTPPLDIKNEDFEFTLQYMTGTASTGWLYISTDDPNYPSFLVNLSGTSAT